MALRFTQKLLHENVIRSIIVRPSFRTCKSVTPDSPKDAKNEEPVKNPGQRSYKPNNLEKKFLVWTKKYKSVEEVPNYVSNEEMERSRNRMRIRISNWMMITTAIACVIMVISGKRASEQGDSVSKQNLDWHKEYNKQKEAEK